MRFGICATGLALLCVLLGGCIEFEKQTILVKLDKEKDVLHARLVYEGIYADGKDFSKDLAELEDVADGGTRFFLLDNWPMEIDLAKPEKGKADDPGMAILRPHTTLKNGTFFLDDEGRLSGWQDIEIRNFTKVLQSFNRLLSLAVITGQDKMLKDGDAETKVLNKSLALAGHEWIRLDETGIHVTFAVSDADAAKMKRGFLMDLIKEAPKAEPEEKDAERGDPHEPGHPKSPPVEDPTPSDAEGEEKSGEITDFEAALRIVTQNRLCLVHRGNRITLTLPTDDKGVIRAFWWNETEYVPNLLEPKKGEETPPKLPAKVDRELKLRMLLDSF